MAHGDTHYKIKSDSVEAIASRLHPKVMVLFIYLFVTLIYGLVRQ